MVGTQEQHRFGPATSLRREANLMKWHNEAAFRGVRARDAQTLVG
jgi:hypothetical protein